MYYLLTALLLAFGIYTLVGNFITFPTKRTEKAMSTFKRKQGKTVPVIIDNIVTTLNRIQACEEQNEDDEEMEF